MPARPPTDLDDAWTVEPALGMTRAPAPAYADGTRHRHASPGCRTRRAPTHLVVVLDDGRAAHVRAADAQVEPAAEVYDATRSLGHVTFDGAPATLLDVGAADTAAAWYIAQTLLGAEAVGAVDVALQRSVEYAKERHTFGRAIGSYQAVKHELVEMLRGLDNARSLMYYAGWAAQDKPEEFAAGRVRVPARRRQGVRPRGARADLGPRRHRRDVGARRAALLPARAALAPAARRDGRRGGPRGGRADRRGAGGLGGAGAGTTNSAPRWRRGPTTAGRSRCRPATASRSPSTGSWPSASWPTGSSRRTRCTSRTRSRGTQLADVHDCGLLSRLREGCLTTREERGLGLPWSRALVERARRATGGTLAAARHALRTGVAMNLGGGTHHAGHDFARGYCVFNDVAVALAALRRDGRAGRAHRRRLRRPPGRRHGADHGRRPAHVHALAPRRAQLPVPPHPLRPRRRHRHRHRRRPLPARAARGARLRARPRAARASPSTWPAPTRGRATGSAASRSARRGCGRATSTCSTRSPTPAPTSAWCSRAATRDDVRDTVDIHAATAAAVAARTPAPLPR